MANEGLAKTFIAGAAIAPRRIVKFGADDRTVLPSAAAADLGIGVSDSLGEDTIGQPVDIIIDGIANIDYGGTIVRGQKLISDAAGKAIAATAAAGANVQVIGFAMLSGVAGDIGKVRIAPSVMQG